MLAKVGQNFFSRSLNRPDRLLEQRLVWISAVSKQSQKVFSAAWLVAQQGVGALDVDVLKLGHHGSRTSSTATLLDAATPRLAIASVGAGNRYGHPSPETLAALMARGVPVFRTDTDGTVIVQTDGRTLQVMAGGEQWQIPQEDRVP